MDEDIQAVAGSNGVSLHSGFPNPADERLRQGGLALDINRLLVKNPSSTYLFRVSGHSWADQGVYDGDIAVVDRAASNPNGLVIAWRGSGLALCRRRQLAPEDRLWGTVTAVIHPFS